MIYEIFNFIYKVSVVILLAVTLVPLGIMMFLEIINMIKKAINFMQNRKIPKVIISLIIIIPLGISIITIIPLGIMTYNYHSKQLSMATQVNVAKRGGYEGSDNFLNKEQLNVVEKTHESPWNYNDTQSSSYDRKKAIVNGVDFICMAYTIFIVGMVLMLIGMALKSLIGMLFEVIEN